MTTFKNWAEMTTDERNEYVRFAVGRFPLAKQAAEAVGTTKNAIVSCSHRAGVRFTSGRCNPYDSRNGRKSRAMSAEELEARRLARAERREQRKQENAQRRPQTSFNAFVRTKTADTPEKRAGEAAGPENGASKGAKIAAEAKAWGRIDALPIWDPLPDAIVEPKELWELGACECHWPVWRDGTTRYMCCASPTTPGELYCGSHRQLAGGRKAGARPGDNDERTLDAIYIKSGRSKEAKAGAGGPRKGPHLRLVQSASG